MPPPPPSPSPSSSIAERESRPIGLRILLTARPLWPFGRRCRSSRRSTTSATVKRRRLLDRMPIGLIGGDNASEDVLVRPVSAAAVVLGAARLDPDFGD